MSHDDILNPKKRFTKVAITEIHKWDCSPQAKWLYVTLLGFYQFNKDGIHPSQKYLSDKLKISTRQITRLLHELKMMGLLQWVQVQKKKGVSNKYFLDKEMIDALNKKQNTIKQSKKHIESDNFKRKYLKMVVNND